MAVLAHACNYRGLTAVLLPAPPPPPLARPSDRKGEFKPRRQAEGAKVDLDFITGDDSGDRPASQTSIGSFLGFGSGPRVSVTLSGLRAKVNADELDQDNTLADYKELLAIDEGGGDAPTADGEADADDSEDDDDGKRAFASMAGL